MSRVETGIQKWLASDGVLNPEKRQEWFVAVDSSQDIFFEFFDQKRIYFDDELIKSFKLFAEHVVHLVPSTEQVNHNVPRPAQDLLEFQFLEFNKLGRALEKQCVRVLSEE